MSLSVAAIISPASMNVSSPSKGVGPDGSEAVCILSGLGTGAGKPFFFSISLLLANFLTKAVAITATKTNKATASAMTRPPLGLNPVDSD
jgi:hypothetical protein